MSASERLLRIAEAHTSRSFSGGLTDGLCCECSRPWPCPTLVWALADRDPLASWDPADDEPEDE